MSFKYVGLGGIAFVLIGGCAWYFGSPYMVLNSLKSAVEAKDVDQVSAHIDFEALKSDLKSDLSMTMMAEAQEDTSGMGALGSIMGMAVIGPMIDGMVSPAGIQKLLETADAADEINPLESAPSQNKEKADWKLDRVNASKFRILRKSDPDGAVIFERRGLSWKLTGVDLPKTPTLSAQ